MTRLIRTAGVFLAVAALVGTAAEIASFAQAPAQPAGAVPVFPQAMPDCLAFGEARTAVHSGTGLLRFIGTDPARPILNPRRSAAATPESAALGYLAACGTLFGLRDAATELAVTRTTPIDGMRRAVRLQQRHQGIPVLGGELIVHLDNNNDVLSVVGETVPSMAIGSTPAESTRPRRRGPRAIWSPRPFDLGRHAHHIHAGVVGVHASADEPRARRGRRSSGAWTSGARTLARPRTGARGRAAGFGRAPFQPGRNAQNRLTYNSATRQTLPGTLVCNESNPTCTGGDADAVGRASLRRRHVRFLPTNFGRDSLTTPRADPRLERALRTRSGTRTPSGTAHRWPTATASRRPTTSSDTS